MDNVNHRNIITRFGGVRRLAGLLGHKNASTVQGWWKRGCIPTRRQCDLLTLAANLNVPLKPDDFFDIDAITVTPVADAVAVAGGR